MLQFSDLNPELLDPAYDPLVFRAILGAQGLYSTEKFVLRLPRVHQMMDAILRARRWLGSCGDCAGLLDVSA